MLQATVRNILVIKLRNIGDVLLTSPVFANLRLHYPAARLCAVVNGGTEEMLTGNPHIDQVYVYDRDRLHGLSPVRRLAGEIGFLFQLRKEKFDLVLNLTEGDRGAILSLLSGAKVRVGIRAVGRGMVGKNHMFSYLVGLPEPDLHTVEQNLRLLSPLGVPVREKKVSFSFDPADRRLISDRLEAAGLKPGRFFHAHLTSRWMFKTMPPAITARLVDELAGRTGLPAVFTAAPVAREEAYLQEVLALSDSPRLSLGGELTLKQLGALTSQARFFVGVDSAPMHLAAALDIPVLGVFGPSSAGLWGPWDNNLQQNPYRQKRGIQTSGRHVVLQSDRECVPCHRDGCKGSKVSDCLAFDEAYVKRAIDIFLAGGPGKKEFAGPGASVELKKPAGV